MPLSGPYRSRRLIDEISAINLVTLTSQIVVIMFYDEIFWNHEWRKGKKEKKISENVELQHWLESFVFDRVIPATKAENKSDDYRG